MADRPMTVRLALALIAAFFVLGFLVGHAAASRPAPTLSYPEQVWTPIGTPSQIRTSTPAASLSPAPSVAAQRPAQSMTGHLEGVASWGYGWAGVVTRLRRGTPICVTGPRGRWCGRSVGYGPAKWTHRIADLSKAVFSAICGAPSRGLCRVELRW